MFKKVNWASILRKAMSVLPAIALFIGVASLNSACLTLYHQPETPSELDEYRK